MLRCSIFGLFCLAIVGLAIACGDEDAETDTSQQPTTTVAAATATPSRPGDPTDAATAGRDRDAAARAEALELCPEESLESCVEMWVDTARTLLPWALCVNEDTGTWFEETPGGEPGNPAEGVEVGDACSGDPSHTVVALHNYP